MFLLDATAILLVSAAVFGWLSHRVRDETAEVVLRAVMNPDLL